MKSKKVLSKATFVNLASCLTNKTKEQKVTQVTKVEQRLHSSYIFYSADGNDYDHFAYLSNDITMVVIVITMLTTKCLSLKGRKNRVLSFKNPGSTAA